MERLLAGEKDVIYHIFEWALPQQEQLAKQADIGYYLTFPDVGHFFKSICKSTATCWDGIMLA